jgi:SAM-dependent methyltransferase
MTACFSGDCEILEYEQSQDSDDISFFTEIAVEAAGPVLDLGCGTGRISLPSAVYGLDVACIDISASMLRSFREKLMRLPAETAQRVSLVRADMRRFALKKKFASAIYSSNSLLLMGSERAVKEALICTAEHLQHGGLLLIDVASIDENIVRGLSQYAIGDIPDMLLQTPDARKLQRTHTLSLQPSGTGSGTLEVKYSYFTDNGIMCDQRQETLALIRPPKLLALVEQAGFSIPKTYGWYDRRPYTEAERKLIVIAERQ